MTPATSPVSAEALEELTLRYAELDRLRGRTSPTPLPPHFSEAASSRRDGERSEPSEPGSDERSESSREAVSTAPPSPLRFPHAPDSPGNSSVIVGKDHPSLSANIKRHCVDRSQSPPSEAPSPFSKTFSTLALDRTRKRSGYERVVLEAGEHAQCDDCGELLFYGMAAWVRAPWGKGKFPNVKCEDCARARGIGKPRGRQAKGKGKAQDRGSIIELLTHDGEASAPEIAEAISRPMRTAQRRLDGLVQEGIVLRVEVARAGRRGRCVT
jgi:hypothetical protein